MDQIIQVAGALLVLIGFLLTQLRTWSTDSWGYLGVNVVGAGILAWVGFAGAQWGFFMLEGVWTLVTLWSLARKMRGTDAAASAA